MNRAQTLRYQVIKKGNKVIVVGADRYHGTVGRVIDFKYGFPLVRSLYGKYLDYGAEYKRKGWTCLFSPDRLRKVTK